MFTTEEIYLDGRRHDGWSWFSRLKPLAHKLLRLPGLSRLVPTARRVASVAAPTRRLLFRAYPTKQRDGEGAEITILSANLCHDWPRHRRLRQRLEAVAQLIESEQVDIALLQEVARTPTIRADEWLSQRLGMAFLYSTANGHETAVGFEEGLAIYSRFPLTAPTVTKLNPGSPITHRLGLGARVDTSFGTLQVFSVHLGLLPARNAAQLAYLRDWTATISENYPSVVGGDFNAHENSPQIARAKKAWIDTFRHLHPDADGATHEFRWPWGTKRRRRLDYLFLQPTNTEFQVLSARHLMAPGGPHSDHQAVLTRLKLSEQPSNVTSGYPNSSRVRYQFPRRRSASFGARS